MKEIVLRSIGAMFALSLASVVHGAPITFNFTGTVIGAQSGSFAGQGSTVSGSYTYDTDLTDSDPFDVFQDTFSSNTSANLGFDYNITVTNGSFSLSSTNIGTAGNSHFLRFRDHVFDDQFLYEAADGNPGVDRFRLVLTDRTPEGAPDGIATGSGNLLHSPLMNPLDVGLFNCSPTCTSYVVEDDDEGFPISHLEFQISSISLQLVPIPGAVWLFGSAIGLLGWMKRRQTA
jgi:hypothetical protein